MNPLRHYQFEYLLDGEIALLRGTAAGCSPVLVMLAGSAANAGAVQRRLEHEYALQHLLRPEWAAVPVALTRYNGRPALVAADQGGLPLALSLGEPFQVDAFLDIAIAVADAMAAMHDAGAVHLDIKPAHLLVAPNLQRAWITGFGIAAVASPGAAHGAASPMLAGTLAYMAPEQSGRGKTAVDARADLYALGVTFYQMLTGALPLEASEPVAWVHSHLARQPVAPIERSAGIPPVLSAMVMRLLAKAPAERYPDAAALAAELRRCRDAWRTQGSLDALPDSGRAGLSGFALPTALYGRARELDVLRQLHREATEQGGPALAASYVLVTGCAGSGKSALAEAFCRSLEAAGGVVARAKAQQHQRGTPLAAVAEICADLATQASASAIAQQHGWAAAMAAAIGDDAEMFVELVPAFAAWLPRREAARDACAGHAKARFQQAFRRLLCVFGSVAPPLVLLLDDLQWTDRESLEVFGSLRQAPLQQPLLVIGTCRTDAIEGGAPGEWLAALRQHGALRGELAMTPLDASALTALVADTLGCSGDRAQAIAQLAYRKTSGNPLFFLQYLRALHRSGLLHVGEADARRDPRDASPGIPDAEIDILGLLTEELQRLPRETLALLTALSCLGSAVSSATAAQAWGASAADIASLLAHAIAAGHVVPGENGYHFSHDRVQEVAYGAIPAADRAALHLRLARRLAQRLDRDAGSSLFEAIDQFNRAADAITDDGERIEVAALNRDAGHRAMRTTAYGAASAYFAAGERLLPEAAWETHHALALALAMGRAECEFVGGRLAAAAATLQDLCARARTPSELAAITRLRVAVHTALDQSDQAVQVGLAFIQTMGLDFLPRARGQVEQEYRRFLVLLGGRPVEALASLPRMHDPAWRATLSVLTEVMSPASFMDRNLRDLIPIWMAIISLEHGNDEASCIAYVHLGMTLGPRLGDYGLGYRLGKVGLALVAQEGMGRFRAKVHMCFGALLSPWTQPVRGGRELIERSFEEGRQTGDFNFAAYSRNQLVTHLLACGEALADVEAKIDTGLAFARTLGLGRVVDILGAQARYVAVLRGRVPGWTVLEAGVPGPQKIEARLQTDPRLAVAACCYWIRKLQACFAVDDFRGALEAAGKAEPMLWAAPYFLEIADYNFFAALSLAWLPRTAGRDPGSEGGAEMAAFDRHQRQMNVWARQNPANFGARAGILAAEAARLARDPLQAMRHYEQAARLAREQDLLHDEALAYELCARCCFEQDLEALAMAYLRRASDAYGRWGADGQVDKLEACARTFDTTGLGTVSATPDRSHAATTQPATYIGPAAQLDLDTAIKATQVLAGEMQLDRLIEALLTTTLQQAAAQRALLFLWQDGMLRLAALARTERTGIAVDLKPAGTAYPRTVVDAALATRSDFVLDNAKSHARFGQDPDVQLRSVRSVACLALVKQGELVGLLYLENNLADALFTGRRINLLSLLASQAAISLENARLYAELLRQNQERQRVQAELAHVSRVTTLGELAASIAHEVNQPLTGIVTYGGACLRWINRPEPDLDEARHAVENMIAEGLRASEVIRRIRALARKDDSRRLLFHLGELAAETMSMVRHQAEFHGIAIAQECAPGLPQVLGDRIQLQQVIINLLINAIQAMSSCVPGQRQLRLSAARQADGQVMLRVEDSGPGIEAGLLDKLFEAFYTTRSEGLGMGLSICRSIVEAHGGCIWAESPVRAAAPGGQGPGAAFCFTLPVPLAQP
ncbi:trifunctional serine/threonine-protein kinase/ATP-binding protein/sensor histidine kinase [Cupriavidus basilensis]|uniref:trifunctional serine/threonine-protein kinase/ATP-binding protein/sensor histidine kinase n=1 Tax=Cupriavidus basilensis TaxID=68895 RepID=UPI0023E7E83B|nr:AAA family ATPase [Cupriavidus basilensis]MDF3887370.1 AAA family ATPase [Cupriavidus basilensis]